MKGSKWSVALCSACVMCISSSFAGLLYEPSNYVAQDNLVLNFDGIRNAGLLKAHDNAAETWKNIGRAANDAVLVGNDSPANAWTADGYRFDGGTYGVLKYAQDLGGQLTIQIVCDVKSSENHTSWPTMFGNWNDRANIYYSDSLTTVHFKADYTTGLAPGSRSKIGGWHGRYLNAGLDSAAHRQTLTEDVSFSSWIGGSSANTSPGVETWTLGSAGANGGLSQEELNARYLVGTIKAVRVYNKVLSDDELAANRAIDEARFFAGIPVTNVVVATSVAGLEGNEGTGAYAYDDAGYTFTAPQKASLDGTVYACTGYKLETWNGSVWSAPVYRQCTSYAATDTSSKVRITWHWQRVSGVAYTDLDPLFEEYVTDGLVLHLDGIRNVGADKPHDWSSPQWIDLVNGNIASFQHDDADESTWQDDGYYFGGRSFAQFVNALSGLANAVTVQVVCDTTTNALAKLRAESGNVVTWPNLVGTGDNDQLNIYYDMNKGNDVLTLKNANGGNANIPKGAWEGRYATAIRNGTKNYLTQTASLDDAGEADAASANIGTETLRVGCACSTFAKRQQRWFLGTIKAVRIYNRVLSDDELAWNREIDEARFFGGPMPVENVVVASSVRGVGGNEPEGNYMLPPGGHTFTAPATVTVGEDTYFCTGYTLEEASDGEGWSAPALHSGNLAAALTDTTAKVRLTWQWTHTAGPGYDAAFSDYVTDGLVVHLDGIRNIGVQAVHDYGAVRWTDLAAKGGAASFVTGSAGSRWMNDGYYFDGAANASYAIMNGVRTVGAAFTTQAVLDFDCNASHRRNVAWPIIIGTTQANDEFSMYYNQNNIETPAVMLKVANTRTQNIPSWGGEYVTARADGTSIAQFETALPTAAPSPFTKEPGTRTFTFGSGDGSDNRFNSRKLTGTIKSIRIYNRPLTDEELERNRAVDEVRFFGRSPAPTGMLIVASDVDGLSGNQLNGLYHPVTSYSFTAPEEAVHGGVPYELSGYTLETWNGSAWEVVESNPGTWAEIDVSSASKRLTWNWRVKSRLTHIPDYDVGDYVQDGLYLHFDGIRNAGADVGHDDAATTWANLGTGGAGFNATFDYADNASAGDGWAADGYNFVYGGKFAKLGDNPSLGWQVTVQIVCEGRPSGKTSGNSWPTYFGAADDYLNIYGLGRDATLWTKIFNNQVESDGNKAGGRVELSPSASWQWRYITLDWHAGKYAIFQSATPDPSIWAGKWRYNWSTFSDQPFYIGGVYKEGNANYVNERRLTGKVQAVRVYNRSLSDEELEHNRMVDEARFRGNTPEWNVRIAPGEYSASVEAAGNYCVEGTYTFTAEDAVENGNRRSLKGCRIESWNGSSWGASTYSPGASYTYTEGVSPAKVRVTWLWQGDGSVFFIR